MTLLASRHCDQKLHQLRIGQQPVGARRVSEISNTNEYGSNANAEVKMKRSLMATAMATAALFALATFSSTADAARVRVGTLDCDISGGIGLIVTSKKGVSCLYAPSGNDWRQQYVGTIRKFGLDLGATAGGRMVWAVFADTVGPRAALSGTYVGASGEATVGVGLGANVLVGGSNRSFALQPVSVQGQAGLNLAVGVADLQLVRVR